MSDLILKEVLKGYFDVDLPISGGNGQSIDAPIIIDVEKDGVRIEYQIIDLIHKLGDKSWTLEKQEIRPVGDRMIDILSIVLADDPDHYHDYYFDITATYNGRNK